MPDGALENSDMVRELCSSNRLTLTENKRSDQVLYDFYTSLSARPLADALAEARTPFPVTDEISDTTLVISHGRSRYLNVKRNVSEMPIHSVYFRAPVTGATGNGPQNMFLWPGLRVVGGGGPFQKGVFATTESISPDSEVVLDNGIRLTASQASRSIRLAYANTYSSCQGMTLQGRVRLGCTGSKHFTHRHLYVGSSRATAHTLLEVA